MGMDERMRGETSPVVLGLYRRLRTKTYNNHYRLIAEFLTDAGIRDIGRSPLGEDTLLWASHKLAQNSRYLFWERILQNRHCFSEQFLAAIWYELFTDCGNRNHQHPVEADGTENDFDWHGDLNLERLATSVITSPRLLDSATVVRCYCQARKEGWKTLRYLHAGRSWRTLHIWENLRQELEEDFAPGFELRRTMLGICPSFSLLVCIINCRAWNVLRNLLSNCLTEVEKVVPLEEIACHAVAQLPDDTAITVLEILETVRPGIIAGFRDAFGQNLLWYEMANPRTCWFHPDCRLTAFLLKHGCSPDHPTHLGLSWRFLTDSLGDQSKKLIWNRRTAVNKKLTEEQPNLWAK